MRARAPIAETRRLTDDDERLLRALQLVAALRAPLLAHLLEQLDLVDARRDLGPVPARALLLRARLAPRLGRDATG